MRLFLLLLILTLAQNLLIAQSKKNWEDLNKCVPSWEYFDVKDSTPGVVLFDKTAPVDCGIFSSASLSIIRTVKGDTIRVLGLCNTKSSFAKGTMVIIQPQKKPSFGIDFLPYDALGCKIKRTTFGKIQVGHSP